MVLFDFADYSGAQAERDAVSGDVDELPLLPEALVRALRVRDASRGFDE
jgi:hypothetical protein